MGGNNAGRGSSGVVPMAENTAEYARLGKHGQGRQRQAASSGRRLIPARGWLMLFLLVNLFAIAVFIFSSAVYFPSASTSGVVKQAINQGDMSLLELPGRGGTDAESPVHNEETPAPVDDNAFEITTEKDEPTDSIKKPTETKPTVSTTDPVQQPTLERKPRLRSETELAEDSPNAENDVPAMEEVGITAVEGERQAQEPTEIVATANEFHAVTFPSTVTPDETPVPTTPTAVTLPVGGNGELLRKNADSPLLSTEVPLAEETVAVESELPRDGLQAPPEDEAFEKNLVVWLKADEGVEVESPTECEALGSACDVKVWKSAVADQSQRPIIFEPVSAAMRPVLQPMAQNNLPLLSFTCGMAHTSGILLHDMMTLFFVLSPSRIEQGDTYRAQKFFGNSPYGQFLFHGGKPAFFTTGGLRESDFVASNDELVLVTYRLQRHAVEIKTNGQQWSAQGDDDDDAFAIRMSGNAALSLGNVKAACDTNAFQGLIAEVLVYDSVLSDQRVNQVEQYLLRKWWGRNAPTAQSTTAAVSSPVIERGADVATMQPEVEDPVTSAMVLNQNGDDMTLDGVLPTATATEPPPLETPPEHDNEVEQEPTVPQDKDAEKKEQADEEVDQTESYPRTFDPEGVFEWQPPADLLAAITKHKDVDTASLVDQWTKTVREKVDSVRNFQFGGEVLRSFIRSRRDELLTLREELFG